jgi:hypothetical protein
LAGDSDIGTAVTLGAWMLFADLDAFDSLKSLVIPGFGGP